MRCERCGKKRTCPHLIPMKRGVFAQVCSDCKQLIYERLRIGKSIRLDFLGELFRPEDRSGLTISPRGDT